jgi:hypothetical protein
MFFCDGFFCRRSAVKFLRVSAFKFISLIYICSILWSDGELRVWMRNIGSSFLETKQKLDEARSCWANLWKQLRF